MKLTQLGLILLVAISFLAIDVAYAEERNVKILNGNVDPRCIETKCYDPVNIKIMTGDTVVWYNEDIPAHTIVSGSPFEGQDGSFDSGLILPQKEFRQTFVRDGTFPYFCVLHPWASGTVIVSGTPIDTSDVQDGDGIVPVEPDAETKTVKTLGLIGQKVGDGKSFSMTYISKGNIEHSFVDQNEKFILFTFSTPAPTDDEIIMKIHEEMVINPSFVEVNGVQLTEYNYVKQGNYNALMFRAPAEVWEVKVYGSAVVPEFGSVAMIILVVAIVGIITVSARAKVIPRF